MISDLKNLVGKTCQLLHLESSMFNCSQNGTTTSCTKVECKERFVFHVVIFKEVQRYSLLDYKKLQFLTFKLYILIIKELSETIMFLLIVKKRNKTETTVHKFSKKQELLFKKPQLNNDSTLIL